MSDPLNRGEESYPKRAQIRKNRRAAQIADKYELLQEGPWVYSIVRGSGEDEILARPHALLFEYHGHEAEVEVPAMLGGLPVLELYNKVFYDRDDIRKVVLPYCVRSIGLKVFARSTSLEEVRLPNALRALDAATFQGCARLSKVHLPASLFVLEDRLLSGCPLERLEIGPALSKLEWTAAKHPGLREVAVDPANRSFASDGLGIYTRDGLWLVRLLVQVPEYALVPGCERVGDSACKNVRALGRVELGERLEEIGPFAFFGTGLAELSLPRSLRRIETRAFSNCERLAHVDFPEGLVEIGSSAFCASGLREASLPASLRYLYTDAFAGTPLLEGAVPALKISPRNRWLFTDGEVFYERRGEGLIATGAFRVGEKCALKEGTLSVEPGAFADQRELRELVLPQGLQTIGDGAFRSCRSLAKATLPMSLRSIGSEAFARTALARIELGAQVERIGARAFAGINAGGANAAGAAQAFPQVTLSEENRAFYLRGNVLCQRGPAGDTAVLYTGDGREAEIPAGVTRIAGFSFMRAPLRRLHIPATVTAIDVDAFNGMDRLEELVIDYDPPLEGRSVARIVFPGDANSAQVLARSLSFDEDGRLFRYADYDSWVRNYWLLNKRNSVTVARMILARLDCPVKLSGRARRELSTCMKTMLATVCDEFARQRDLKSLARLEEHGFINVGNIDAVLRGSEAAGEAEATAYLLEMKNRKFGIGKRDFSL